MLLAYDQKPKYGSRYSIIYILLVIAMGNHPESSAQVK